MVIKNLLTLFIAASFVGSAHAALLTEAPLSNAVGGTPLSSSYQGDPVNLLTAGNLSTLGDDNGWIYDPNNIPTLNPPEQRNNGVGGAGVGFLTDNDDAENYWYADISNPGEIRFLDVWGRSDYGGSEQSRHQDLVITLYDSTGATGNVLFTSSAWNGVTTNSTTPPSFGRFDFVAGGATTTALTDAQSIRIDHSPGNSDYLFLMEVRVAAIPEPASLMLLGFGSLLIAGRHHHK